LAKDRSPNSLISFLRQHYTTGIQQAGALAAYLASVPSTPEPRGGRPLMPTRVSPPERPPAQIDPRRAVRPESPGRATDDDGSGLRVRRPPRPVDARKPAEVEKPSPIPEPTAAAKVPEERDIPTSAVAPPVAPAAPVPPKLPEIPL
jgi:hypothetical protein